MVPLGGDYGQAYRTSVRSGHCRPPPHAAQDDSLGHAEQLAAHFAIVLGLRRTNLLSERQCTLVCFAGCIRVSCKQDAFTLPHLLRCDTSSALAAFRQTAHEDSHAYVGGGEYLKAFVLDVRSSPLWTGNERASSPHTTAHVYSRTATARNSIAVALFRFVRV